MTVTPKSLLLRLRQSDDAEAWQHMLAIYNPLLRQWLKGQGIAPSNADDLAQDVLMVVCRRIGEFDHNGRAGAFRNWLKTIVLNRTREFWRSGRLRQGTAENDVLLAQFEDPQSGFNSWWDHEHDKLVVKRALALVENDFSPRVKELFDLFVLQDLSAEDVAARTGASLHSVYAAKSRVLARLRQELAELVDL